MSLKQHEISDKYQKYFDPHEFRDTKLQLLKFENWKITMEFWFSSLYQFFSNEKFNGDRLLDLASGPCIHNIATAASHFRNIVLSDYVDRNRVELEKWLRNDPDCLDWTFYLRMISKAEMREDIDIAVEEIRNRIQSAVKAVIYCDILSDEIIAEEHRCQPFDLIISALTLEPSIADEDSYSTCIGRISNLLKKGGKFIIMGFLERCAGSYTIGSQKFHYLPIKKCVMFTALENNGFENIKWSFKEQPNKDSPPFCEKAYFVTCTKT